MDKILKNLFLIINNKNRIIGIIRFSSFSNNLRDYIMCRHSEPLVIMPCNRFADLHFICNYDNSYDMFCHSSLGNLRLPISQELKNVIDNMLLKV